MKYLGRIFLFLSFAILISGTSAFAASDFPFRSYLYSLQIQDQSRQIEDLKNDIVSRVNANQKRHFNSFEDLEALPAAEQQTLIRNLKKFNSQLPVPLESTNPSTPRVRKSQPPAPKGFLAKLRLRLFGPKKPVQPVDPWAGRAGNPPQVIPQANNSKNNDEPDYAHFIWDDLKPKDYLEKLKKHLEGGLKGQPEAIEAALGIEKKTAFYGFTRKLPEVLVLMGLPGTGKDTLVETWVDGMYDEEDAWNEHVFRAPILKSRHDLWGLLGSTTGHVGSDKMPPFIRWLVDHSGGKYKVKGQTSVIINPEYVEGKVLEGYYPPEKAVLFVNEFHNWSKDLTDSFLKQALEKGYFQLNNPGDGVAELYVPINIVIATNSGTNLIASRELNGQRYGPPLSYEQMLERWKASQGDEDILKGELQRVNGSKNGSTSYEGAPGISEEVLDRLNNFVLMRPLSPETMRDITISKLRKLQNKINIALQNVRLEPTAELVDFLVGYDYAAEKSGRSYEKKIINLIEQPLVEALISERLTLSRNAVVELDILTNENKTSSLIVRIENKDEIVLPIPFTEKDTERETLSEDEIAELATLATRLAKHVVGAHNVIKRLSRRILVSEDARRAKVTTENATNPAQSYMFLGPSSVGKTELAKALAKELFKDQGAYELIDFSRISSKYDLEQLILGIRDGHGDGKPSPFMKAYDRLHGRAVFVFDEVANAPKEVLKALYDILREPVVTTFSDGKPRVMSNAIILMTGNAGEEWYEDIPRDIPEIEQQEAMDQIYKHASNDPDFQRKFLEKTFSPALLNRIGANNIFFFPGLNFADVRGLTYIKVRNELKKLAPIEGRLGWDVNFAQLDDYLRLVETIEDEGFVLWEQGASIDRFTRDILDTELRYLLITHNVPNGSKVVIQSVKESSSPGMIQFNLITESGETIVMEVKKQVRKPQVRTADVDRILVAFHEAGHDVVREVVFGDKLKTDGVSIVPGVMKMNDRWIRYLGVAKYSMEESWMYTREAVVAQIAQMAAGEVGQTIVTKGERHDAGKGNDMERASQIATVAILQWGLSEKWGRAAIPQGQNLDTYLESLTPERKELFQSELKAFLEEGRKMARDILMANFEALFLPLALRLAEEGFVNGPELQKFYDDNRSSIIFPLDPETQKRVEAYEKAHPDIQKPALTRDAELLDELQLPRFVADVNKLRDENRRKMQESVPVPEDVPLLSEEECKTLLPKAP